MKDTIQFAKKVADSKSTVLITGESGCGKELFSQAIHNYSPRRDEPFVAINSGAIPRTLIESELFGYDDGAFTGAKRGGQVGKFEIADGGTIFLDEIGEMPLEMQPKLLRVIEEGTIVRVGGTDEVRVDVRIIAATNKDLKAEVEKGNFRQDLYYRLNVIPIKLSPLRERREDIPLLVDHFMHIISKRINKKPIQISEPDMQWLITRPWQGNVRELENYIELAINKEKLEFDTVSTLDAGQIPEVQDSDCVSSLDEVEKKHIQRILHSVSNNITTAARILGIGRNTLYRKLEKHNILLEK
jgi:transcriptional regulator with PAS, ATPase and Fis domain